MPGKCSFWLMVSGVPDHLARTCAEKLGTYGREKQIMLIASRKEEGREGNLNTYTHTRYKGDPNIPSRHIYPGGLTSKSSTTFQ